MQQRQLFAIVLAAGGATRFGSAKQIADFNGQPLASHAVRAAEDACGGNTVVVVGDEWPSVHNAVAPLAGFLVRNDNVRSGMASSIVAGLSAVADVADAILLTLVDQPLVDARYLRKLIATWDQSEDRIVCSRYQSVLGPPTLFPARYFAELLDLGGDRGARALLERHADRLIVIPSAAAGIDIDTHEDLVAAQRRLSSDC